MRRRDMARPVGNFEHGTVQRYRQGNCDGNGNRCAPCKQAMSVWKKDQRAGKPVEERAGQLSNVTSIEGRTRSKAQPATSGARPGQSNSQPSASNPVRAMGPVERSIHEQFDQYRAEHGARVELLLSGARIIDNPERESIHPTTMRQMEMIIDKITAKKKTKSGGRLATVSAMAGRRSG